MDWKSRIIAISLLLVISGTSGCSAGIGQPTGPTVTERIPTITHVPIPVTPGVVTGQLLPIIVPSMPAVIPVYLDVDPDTGLHMTGKPTAVDFFLYRLKVSGKVTHELSLTYDDLRMLPKTTASPLLICEGFFTDQATWSGVPLTTILEMAGIRSDASQIVMTSADGYKTMLTMEEALAPDNFLAYEMNGRTLPILHGFPLRAIIPDMTGFAWAKWLQEIEVK